MGKSRWRRIKFRSRKGQMKRFSSDKVKTTDKSLTVLLKQSARLTKRRGDMDPGLGATMLYRDHVRSEGMIVETKKGRWFNRRHERVYAPEFDMDRWAGMPDGDPRLPPMVEVLRTLHKTGQDVRDHEVNDRPTHRSRNTPKRGRRYGRLRCTCGKVFVTTVAADQHLRNYSAAEQENHCFDFIPDAPKMEIRDVENSRHQWKEKWHTVELEHIETYHLILAFSGNRAFFIEQDEDKQQLRASVEYSVSRAREVFKSGRSDSIYWLPQVYPLRR